MIVFELFSHQIFCKQAQHDKTVIQLKFVCQEGTPVQGIQGARKQLIIYTLYCVSIKLQPQQTKRQLSRSLPKQQQGVVAYLASKGKSKHEKPFRDLPPKQFVATLSESTCAAKKWGLRLKLSNRGGVGVCLESFPCFKIFHPPPNVSRV